MGKPTRVYLDTSVIGGCCDPEFADWSNRLFADFHSFRVVPVSSVLTESELANAPQEVIDIYQGLCDLGMAVVDVTDEAQELAEQYIREGVLTASYRSDALHIAIATTENVDVLVSWNFRHIVRFDRIRRFNAVNLRLGYRFIDIRSPQEVASHGVEDA